MSQRNVPPAADGLAVKVADPPGQIVALSTVTLGIGFTVTIPDAIALVHPFKVYVTVYVVVEAGETEILEPVAPVLHEYVPPPADGVAVRMAVSPGQITSLSELTVGIGFTVTVPLPEEPEQPFKE